MCVGYLSATEPPPASSKPNILIILADDMGYGDLQCYNPEHGKILTPSMDRLAAEGMRFSDAHSSSSVCSPSRYSLMTGRYHWRTRLQSGIVDIFGEPLIVPERMTIGTLAKQQGYATACIGKWHLGWDWPIPKNQRPLFQIPKGNDEGAPTQAHLSAWRDVFTQPIPGGPISRGFDEYFGTNAPNWPPFCFIENDRTVGIPTEFLPPHLLKNNLATKPGPALEGWQLESILPALGERAADFIARQTKAQRPFLLYLPLTSPHTPIAINDQWKGKSRLHYYADFMMETDALVGRVLEALEKAGAAPNTLVLLTSDNGKDPYTGASELEQKGHFSSGPFRGYKHSVYEGGHRMPFIVRWPLVVKPGSVCRQLVGQTDILATLAQIWGVKLPDNAGEDSFSFLQLLKGAEEPVRQSAVSTSAAGVPGLRQGPWKLILEADQQAKVQLYNLEEDPAETHNRAADEPERVAGMSALLEKLIVNGRSTPGLIQKNDVKVVRFPRQSTPTPRNNCCHQQPEK